LLHSAALQLETYLVEQKIFTDADSTSKTDTPRGAGDEATVSSATAALTSAEPGTSFVPIPDVPVVNGQLPVSNGITLPTFPMNLSFPNTAVGLPGMAQ
jgi:hypothetical protein